MQMTAIKSFKFAGAQFSPGDSLAVEDARKARQLIGARWAEQTPATAPVARKGVAHARQ